MDIRQEAARHTEVVSAITEYLGIGKYAEWEEEKRLSFLIKELQGKRPLMPPGTPMSADAKEVVATFRLVLRSSSILLSSLETAFGNQLVLGVGAAMVYW